MRRIGFAFAVAALLAPWFAGPWVAQAQPSPDQADPRDCSVSGRQRNRRDGAPGQRIHESVLSCLIMENITGATGTVATRATAGAARRLYHPVQHELHAFVER